MTDFRADLSGQVALVTGGASGIGLATVRRFAESGARVAVNHLPQDVAALGVIDKLSSEGLAVFSAPGDVADAGQSEKMVGEILRREEGRLNYLVNNAGTSATSAPIEFHDLCAVSEEMWQSILSTNLIGPFRCAKFAASALRASRGSIVNTSSNSGFNTRGSSVAYAASKAGLTNLTKSLARALAPDVRVNAVAPGLVDSPWTSSWPAARKQQAIERSFLGRMATPDDIAEVIVFLAAGAAYVNGHTVVLDGGSV